ncbi:glycerophosphodiester phosphodiesterase [Apilactobacillus sp. TMW 2.2459]|uniref:glycerophosphodiester phosphodiesterase family protein n=1 Tax=Apilactobacillus xinyiensis TaxID=2841032 RepID=UPI00200C7D00|nr:glycerophosphodiester phosphodiesterase family protein [Apilactobacillus xinyiensis]MCL0312441.1 glycerophosphodiester phosphodiesterase [Apilactobacillus xinyiensis]
MNNTMIFGHRGYPARFPENSLEGFRYAIDNNIDGLEFDVHLTKDNVPIVIHDETVTRTTDGVGYIKDMDLSDVKKFKLRNGETIPTLEELLRIVEHKEIFLNLELKTNKIKYENIEWIVTKLIDQFHIINPIIYSSFNLKSLKNLKLINKNAQCCYLTSRKISNPTQFMQKHDLSALHLSYSDQTIMNNERVWTVDSSFRMYNLLRKNVSGIITNNFTKASRIRKLIS